jgi:hypothetical protein
VHDLSTYDVDNIVDVDFEKDQISRDLHLAQNKAYKLLQDLI